MNAKERKITRRLLQRERVQAALDEANGNRRKAAELLGVSREHFVKKMKQLDIPRNKPIIERHQ